MSAGDHLSNRCQQHDPKQGTGLSIIFNTSTSRSHGNALYIEKLSLINLGSHIKCYVQCAFQRQDENSSDQTLFAAGHNQCHNT